MKRILLFALTVLLCVQLCSCVVKHLPATSEHFSRDFVNSFLDNYSVMDPQLSYMSASPWEVEIKTGTHEMDYLFLAPIDDVDQKQFVSGTEIKINYIGQTGYTTMVYQHKDAPIPMRDWNIKSVTILESSYGTLNADLGDGPEHKSEKQMELFLSVATALKTYDKTNDPDFINMIKDAYAARVGYEQGTDRPPEIRKRIDERTLLRFYLLVRFEESENLVWLAKLRSDGKGFYFNSFFSGKDDIDYGDRALAKIDDAYFAEINELIGIID